MKVTSPSLIRRFALEYAVRTRAHPFTRVSGEFLEQVEFAAQRYIKERINHHPSKGQTLT